MVNVTDENNNNDGDPYNDEEFDTSRPSSELTTSQRFQYHNRQTITVAVPLLKSPDDDDGDDQRKIVDTAAAAAVVISDGIIETPPRSANGGRLNDGTILSLDDFMQVSSPAVGELLASMQDKLDEKEETIRQLQDFIADSIETTMGDQWYDGLIALPRCDKTMSGVITEMGRLNQGGTIRAGHRPSTGETLDMVSAFQSYGSFLYNKITEEDRKDILQRSCPGPGNTMATSIEALGMSLPYSSRRFSSSKRLKGDLFEHLQVELSEHRDTQCPSQNQSQSQNESPRSKHKEKGHKKHDKHKKLSSKTNKKKAETQRAAIDSFMTSVKGHGRSSIEDWERLVQSMKAENRSNHNEELRVAFSNGREETKEAGDTVHLIEDVPVPETDQREVVPKNSVISSRKSVKWNDDIEDSTCDFDDEDRLHKIDMFAATQTPSTTLLINNMNNLSEETTLLINNMNNLSEEDVWEDEDDDDYNYNNIESDDLPAASCEKSVDPREAISKTKSPSTALLIEQMEQLSEELLMEVDQWEGSLSFLDNDDDDIGNTAPLHEEKCMGMKSDRRCSQRSTVLLLKRMEDLNEELAVEMDNLNDDDNDGVATKSSAEETVRATGNAKTSSGSPRLPRSTTVLVSGMENLGGLLSVENMEDGLKGELLEHLQVELSEHRDSQSPSQNQSQSQNESPSIKHKEKGHKKLQKKAETQRAAIDSFMTSVKGNRKSSVKDWERLVQSMKAENRSNHNEELRVAFSNYRKETKEAGDTVHLIEDVPVPETDQREVVPKNSVISSRKSVKWKDDFEDSTRDFDNEYRLHKRDMFAATQTPSTTLLINNMNNLSEEDVWEDEDNDDYNYNNIEYDDLPAASCNLESDTTTEKSVDPREAISKTKSPSTALLIEQMEQLSEELLMEVDQWEGSLSFLDNDDDDIGNTAPLHEEKCMGMKSDRRCSQRSTVLLLKRMEDLNEELAVEMDNLNDDDNDGVATKSSAEETVRATGNAKTSSGSPRLPRSTTVLVGGMENLGGLLSVENMEGWF